MTHASLFSGIGGFDLAAEWMGWQNVFHCEWNEFGQQVLKYYWPQAESFTDITKTNFKPYANKVDILTGGFPCQPFSLAGKRKGTEDSRYLWPEMLRAIREIQPRWVVAENVFGLINQQGGLVFEQVCLDLETEGYEVQPFVLPAAAVDAPHNRLRVWIVAYSESKQSERLQPEQREFSQQEQGEFGGGNSENDVANCYSHGCNRSDRKHEVKPGEAGIHALNEIKQNATTNTYSRGFTGEKHGQTQSGFTTETGGPNYWQNFPTQSPVLYGNDGVPTGLDGITFPKWRNESIKAAGNAIVPQVAFEIFKTIKIYEQ
jgi:DNA (cytosine-5)-methyltransferase 1